VFFDKQKTHTMLGAFTIPTVSIKRDKAGSIQKAIIRLKQEILAHPYHKDFSKKMILKDRYGAGGNSIYFITTFNQEKQIYEVMNNDKKTSFILQPFAQFDNGFGYKDYSGIIDTRVIFLNNKIIQSYIRMAKKNDFRCNIHQGGTLSYIPVEDIPLRVRHVAEKIVTVLDEDKALFALDFMTSNTGHVFLLEGNCGPGINWDLSLKDDKKMSKKLIRAIVKSIGIRTQHKIENSSIQIPQEFPPDNHAIGMYA
jgi:glutathione synthase/RimK-type ligase-like ATP-grasp enzyme